MTKRLQTICGAHPQKPVDNDVDVLVRGSMAELLVDSHTRISTGDVATKVATRSRRSGP